jgi:hypothetical protein
MRLIDLGLAALLALPTAFTAPLIACPPLTPGGGEAVSLTAQQGHVGQGTYNMQSGEYNLKYAQSIPVLREQLAASGTTDLNTVRNLVLADEFSFASGAWFLVTQCSAEVRQQLQMGSEEGWAQYISQCVGTEPEPRKAYWQAAVNALA